MRPKFSFVIPTYNEGKYLEGCISSIRAQARDDYEVIVVDSRSTDRTFAIAKKMADKALLTGREGPGTARNEGASLSRGEILVFIDADARIPENFLDSIEEKMNAYGGGICKLEAYDAEKFKHVLIYRLANTMVKSSIRLGSVMTSGSCFVYRKEIFDRIGGFDATIQANEDHDLARRASKHARFGYFGDIKVLTSARRVKKLGFAGTWKTYLRMVLSYFIGHSIAGDYWEKAYSQPDG